MFNRDFQEIENLVDADGSANEHKLYFANRAIDDICWMLSLMTLVYEFTTWAFRRKFVQDAFKLYVNKFVYILVPLLQQDIDSGEFRNINPRAAPSRLG